MQTREEEEKGAHGSLCPHHGIAWAFPQHGYMCGRAMDKWTHKRLMAAETKRLLGPDSPPRHYAVLGEDDGYHDR